MKLETMNKIKFWVFSSMVVIGASIVVWFVVYGPGTKLW